MLLRVQRVALTVAAVAVGAFFFSATWMLWRAPNLFLHVDGTLTRTEATLRKARATLDNLDKGTKVWADSAKEQTGAIEDLATDAHGTLSEANRALQGVSAISQHVSGTADAATGLLASATRTTDELPATMQRLVSDVDATQAPLASATRAMDDLDAFLRSKNLESALEGVSATSQNFGKLSGDLYAWSHPLLNPDPCKTRKCAFGRAIGKVQAVTGFGAQAYQFSNFFKPLNVQIQH